MGLVDLVLSLPTNLHGLEENYGSFHIHLLQQGS